VNKVAIISHLLVSFLSSKTSLKGSKKSN